MRVSSVSGPTRPPETWVSIELGVECLPRGHCRHIVVPSAALSISRALPYFFDRVGDPESPHARRIGERPRSRQGLPTVEKRVSQHDERICQSRDGFEGHRSVLSTLGLAAVLGRTLSARGCGQVHVFQLFHDGSRGSGLAVRRRAEWGSR
jgi:hypothetical protein